MKKIGIFAIGTLLFTVVSCNKDKNQLEPSTNYPMSEQTSPKTGIQNDDLLPGPNYTLKENGTSDGKKPGRPRPHNENEFPVVYNPNKVRSDGARNDVNGNTEIVILPRNFQNENEYPTYHNPEKKPKKGVRNDELINSNTSDL